MGQVERYPDGTFCWVDLGANDAAGAKRVYGGLFGWEFDDLPTGAQGTYSTCRLGGRAVAGLYDRAERPAWGSYISVEDVGWPGEETLLSFCERVLGAAVVYLRDSEKQPFPTMPPEVSLVFTDDPSIQDINAEWRGKDKATNVLSFPAFPVQPGKMPGPMLGDIIIARETLEREAAELEKSFDDHLTHLLVHGFLHLLGYDHMNSAEAEIMEGLETRILADLGLSDPYEGQDLKLEP